MHRRRSYLHWLSDLETWILRFVALICLLHTLYAVVRREFGL